MTHALDEAALLRAAEAQVPNADFCGDEFLPGLRRLLAALRDEAQLEPQGEWTALGRLVASLNRRRRLSQLLARQPEIATGSIEAPVFILGFPRTGTTMLHNLLAADPDSRAIRLWEMREPFAPADAPADWREQMIAQMEQLVAAGYRLSPRLADIHPLRPTWPDECSWLLRNSFATPVLGFSYYIPSYVDWLWSTDQRPVYEFYALQLRAILAQRPGQPLVLKDPCHIWHLDALLASFPDARVIHLHRDIGEVLPSFCSLCQALHEGGARPRGPEAIGAYARDMLARGMERMLAVREQLAAEDEARIIDLDYRELVGDPLAGVAKIYGRLGRELGDEARAAMAAWLEGSRKLTGRHRYSLAGFGLEPAEVRERFAPYAERFAPHLSSAA